MKGLSKQNSVLTDVKQITNRKIGALVDKKRILAIVAPLLIMASMYPIFQVYALYIGNDRIAWYLGLATYWLAWGLIFPILMIGIKSIKDLIKPQITTKTVLVLIAIPLFLAAAAKLVPGMGGYEKESVLIVFLLVSSAFGNGFFEELLWRGVYLKLFSKNIFYRMAWPAFWFGLWHYIPVSSSNSELTGLIGMMVGPMMMGLYLAYLTKKTNTLWWAIVVHTIGGIIMIA